ncbi:MAG: ATP-binding cassette domain-containing protein, partial [Betaproteobacteria bacterium]|nr:ATP-binding cassette domain-containing protein [Betaproteobacteria bacterium]
MASITALRSAMTTAAMPRSPEASDMPLMSSEALVLENVTRAFGALRAVDDVSLSVLAGEKRAILGANGAGKTT